MREVILPLQLQQLIIDSKPGVSVQGKNVQISTGAMSAIDTGTTLIGGPSADVQNIWAAVPGSQPMEGDMQGYYSFRKHLRFFFKCLFAKCN